MNEISKATLFNALAWIDTLKMSQGVKTEEVDIALSRLIEAFGVDIHNVEQKRQMEVHGEVSFDEIFAAGLQALSVEMGTAESAVDDDSVVKKHPELWRRWVAKLETKGFFKEATPGSSEYTVRTSKALAKFKEKFGNVEPERSKEEKEAKAEEFKTQGNEALSRQDYEGAGALYRRALKLSVDGPSSHIYRSNLAAALLYLGKYSEAIDHCEQSISLKPAYVKAYSRMGSAQIQLNDFDGAIDTFRRGLEVDSTNEACCNGLADAERKRQEMQTSSATSRTTPQIGGAGGMPDLSSLAILLGGGGGGLADMMNNPQMMQMAQGMMQNPQMMQMAQNIMQNPNMLNNLMGGGASANAGTGGGGGESSGMPDMSRVMNSPELVAARSDPDLAEFFRDVDTEGPSAAMRHMSNPKVSQLMQSVMSRMQG